MQLHAPDLLRSVRKRKRAIAAPVTSEVKIVRKPLILLAEDSMTTRLQEKRILEAAGYEVVTAVDGVDVGVLEPRQHEPAREVDDVGPRPDVCVQVGFVEDRGHPPARDDEPVVGPSVVAVEDVPVAEDGRSGSHPPSVPSDSVAWPPLRLGVDDESAGIRLIRLLNRLSRRHHGCTDR